MTIGTLLRPAAPSGPVPTNVSFLDDARVETIDAAEVTTHAFVPDRNSTIAVEATAIAAQVGTPAKYALLTNRAVARVDAAGLINSTVGTAVSLGSLATLDLKIVVSGSPQRIEVQVTGIALTSIRWAVSVKLFQLDQST